MTPTHSSVRRQALEDAIEALYIAEDGYEEDGWQTCAVAAINKLINTES